MEMKWVLKGFARFKVDSKYDFKGLLKIWCHGFVRLPHRGEGERRFAPRFKIVNKIVKWHKFDRVASSLKSQF